MAGYLVCGGMIGLQDNIHNYIVIHPVVLAVLAAFCHAVKPAISFNIRFLLHYGGC